MKFNYGCKQFGCQDTLFFLGVIVGVRFCVMSKLGVIVGVSRSGVRNGVTILMQPY